MDTADGAPDHSVVPRIGPEDVRAIVFGSNAHVQELFRQHFGPDIERAIADLGNGYHEFQDLQDSVVLDEHSATVQLFIHTALNSVISSLHLLVSGYAVASGHLMRQFVESIAMALMCSDLRTGVYEAYAANRERFPMAGAPDRLKQKRVRRILEDALGFDPSAWETVLHMNQLYDMLSHASALALAYQLMFTEAGGMVVGPEFDLAKLEEYRSDVTRRRTAADSLRHVIPVIMKHLPRRPPASDGAA